MGEKVLVQDIAAVSERSSEVSLPRVSRRRRQRSATDVERKGASPLVRGDQRVVRIAAVLALTVVGSVLAVGTVHIAVLLVVAPFAALAGALSILRGRVGNRPVPGVAALALGLSLYSVVQALPLPMALLRRLSPGAAMIWTRTLSAVEPAVGWASLSLDPGASLVEGLKWFCYGSVFCAGAAVARALSRHVVPWIVFGSAFVVAVVTLAHRLLAAQSLYGLYTPLARGSSPVAPLVNPNNLAGYLNLGAFVGVGLLMDRRRIAPRWAVGLAISVVIGMSAVCGSRAGLASLALGMVALIIGVRVFNVDGARRLIWIPVAALAGGVALFVLAVNSDLWQSMLKEGAKKLALISWTKPVMADFPIFGIGRGAFETVFPAYRADVGHHIYQFAENFITQWCVEWGIPIGLAACIGFSYLLRPGRLQLRSEVLALCCSIGVLVLVLQNLLDLALEVPSVSLAVFALVGSLWGHRRERPSKLEAKPSLRPALIFAGAFALLWVSVALAGTHTSLEDRSRVAELVAERQSHSPSVGEALKRELIAAFHRHPADPYFPLIAATLAHGEKSAELAFISRAIERDPMSGPPYLLLADALARRHARGQALEAVRLAVERGYELIAPGTRLALGLTHDLDELRTTIPAGPPGVGMLVNLSLQPVLAPSRTQLLQEAMSRDATALQPRVIRASDLTAALEQKSEPCLGEALEICRKEIRALCNAITAIEPSSDRPVVLTARGLLAVGDSRGAYHLLEQRCSLLEAKSDCMRVRFIAAQQLNDSHALEESAASFLAESCATDDSCAATALWVGGQLEASGHPGSAIRMYERAAEEAGTQTAWAQLAETATRLGFAAVADRAHRRAGTPHRNMGSVPRTL